MSIRANTKVHMLDGSVMPIHEIQSGDRLHGHEGIVRIENVMSGTEDKLIRITTNTGKLLEGSYNQLVMTPGGYLHLKYLKHGDSIITFINDVEQIVRVEAMEGNGYTVCQLDTQNALPFFAGEILVGGYGTASK